MDPLFFTATFLALMLLAIVSDIRSMTIPNRLNLALVATFGLAAFASGMAWGTLAAHVATGSFALACMAAMFHFGWMGGGDAKLVGATALWLGPSVLLMDYLLLASLFGGILTLALLSARALRRPTTGVPFLDRLLAPRNGVPYGVALGSAAIIVLCANPGGASI